MQHTSIALQRLQLRRTAACGCQANDPRLQVFSELCYFGVAAGR